MTPRGKLASIFALCVSPVVLSTALYFGAPPAGGKSYGTLLPTRPFADAAPGAWPAGRWVLVQYEAAPCDAACRDRLAGLERIRVAQGEQSNRLATLRLSTAGKAPGSRVLVDPRGYQVLAYPASADPVRLIREVGKVIKTNNGLGREG